MSKGQYTIFLMQIFVRSSPLWGQKLQIWRINKTKCDRETLFCPVMGLKLSKICIRKMAYFLGLDLNRIAPSQIGRSDFFSRVLLAKLISRYCCFVFNILTLEVCWLYLDIDMRSCSCVSVITWLCSRAMRFQSRPRKLTLAHHRESPEAQWLEHPTRKWYLSESKSSFFPSV